MAEILACRRGTVTVMPGCGRLPARLSIEGFEPVAALIESPTAAQQVNAQFMTSLREAVYVYVFGDKMGSVQVRGILFAGLCEGSENGLQELFDYYRDYRASQREDVITITIGRESFSGFLTAMNVQPLESSYITWNFDLTFNTLPRGG